MSALKFILQKEFKQIFRDKGMLPIIFVMPIVQLLVLSFAATFDVKDIKIEIVDRDHSHLSQQLISKYEASNYFSIVNFRNATDPHGEVLQNGSASISLEIPNDFEKDLINNKPVDLSAKVNAIDGMTAGVSASYSQTIIQEFREEFLKSHDFSDVLKEKGMEPFQINFSMKNWYNPTLNYKFYMVPGLLVLLVSMIGLFLTSMNIVKEKEIGTIEQLNVTPITKGEFIVGKLLPFWCIGMFVLSFGLVIAKLFFNVPLLGPLYIIFSFAMIYLLVVLGIGLFISTKADTQQQSMFIAWFFMIVFVLLSGLFTPIENMPVWAQNITLLNPVRYFIEVMRNVLLKGATFTDVKNNFIIISIYAAVVNTMAILAYRKTN
ncbi:ABC transporter permease [Flammeovirga kamogawensis]|uniref:ABC transporter permease n=1 Tax=Flammeovirga kamogawensis TaxID=373891 RepID=A0ABX8GX03_9BACT|nr:ABC transporter permease [Flammeovirga kamogawensis]MBB6461173.1 ABC-2 type transport system permease protein [Flammeovirga kamogawensis]QWG07737.1 ABC transporter permease [Flammeovirga kamogawensis]TRX69544.1 ABC transporter permease [Flammeovirga kamogawensis]